MGWGGGCHQDMTCIQEAFQARPQGSQAYRGPHVARDFRSSYSCEYGAFGIAKCIICTRPCNHPTIPSAWDHTTTCNGIDNGQQPRLRDGILRPDYTNYATATGCNAANVIPPNGSHTTNHGSTSFKHQCTGPKEKRNQMKYCWTHGACNHWGNDCRTPAEGHDSSATFQDRKGGSNKNLEWMVEPKCCNTILT